MKLFFLAAFIILADQLTKHVVENSLYLGQSIPVIPEYFHITLVRNPGAIFGLMAHGRWFFIVVTVVALIILFFLMKNFDSYKFSRLGITLIVSGAVGNLLDRIRFGYVVDFVDFRVWPVFNIADAVLCLGAVFFLYDFITRGYHQKWEELEEE